MADDFLSKFNKKLDDAIQKAKAARMEDERRRLLLTVGQDVAQMIAPAIAEMAQSAKMNKDDMREVMFEILGTVSSRELNIDTKPLIDAIQEAVGGIKIPAPFVRVDNPPINVPPLKMPDEMTVLGMYDLIDIFRNADKNPISVQLRDMKGNPLDLSSFGGMVMGGGGGGFRRIIVDDIRTSTGSLIDPSGALKVTGSFTAAAASSVSLVNSDGTYYNTDNPFPVSIVSGASATSATNIVDSSGVAYSGSNPVPVSIISGSITMSTITSTDAVATQDLPAMLGMNFGFNGASWNRIHTNTGDSAGAMRITFATDAVASVAGTVVVSSVTASVAATLVDSSGVAYSGSNPLPIVGPVVVTSITNTIAANIVDSSGVAYTTANPLPIAWVSGAGVSTAVTIQDSSGVGYSGSNPFPITLAASGGTNTINVSIVDSGGVGYSGANPLPITIVSGALTSTVAVGDSAARSADNGGNPVKVGGIAVKTQPTAYADGDRVNFSADKLGRQLQRPVQVRDLIITAYTSISNGTEATLLSASAGSFHDLLYIMLANSSDAAVLVDIRGVTAGNIIATVAVPANGTAGVSMGAVPVPQSLSDTGNNWTIDMPDITGTTIYATALFSREI